MSDRETMDSMPPPFDDEEEEEDQPLSRQSAASPAASQLKFQAERRSEEAAVASAS